MNKAIGHSYVNFTSRKIQTHMVILSLRIEKAIDHRYVRLSSRQEKILVHGYLRSVSRKRELITVMSGLQAEKMHIHMVILGL